jgi:hypothetical protein
VQRHPEPDWANSFVRQVRFESVSWQFQIHVLNLQFDQVPLGGIKVGIH